MRDSTGSTQLRTVSSRCRLHRSGLPAGRMRGASSSVGHAPTNNHPPRGGAGHRSPSSRRPPRAFEAVQSAFRPLGLTDLENARSTVFPPGRAPRGSAAGPRRPSSRRILEALEGGGETRQALRGHFRRVTKRLPQGIGLTLLQSVGGTQASPGFLADGRIWA